MDVEGTCGSKDDRCSLDVAFKKYSQSTEKILEFLLGNDGKYRLDGYPLPFAIPKVKTFRLTGEEEESPIFTTNTIHETNVFEMRSSVVVEFHNIAIRNLTFTNEGQSFVHGENKEWNGKLFFERCGVWFCHSYFKHGSITRLGGFVFRGSGVKEISFSHSQFISSNPLVMIDTLAKFTMTGSFLNDTEFSVGLKDTTVLIDSCRLKTGSIYLIPISKAEEAAMDESEILVHNMSSVVAHQTASEWFSDNLIEVSTGKSCVISSSNFVDTIISFIPTLQTAKILNTTFDKNLDLYQSFQSSIRLSPLENVILENVFINAAQVEFQKPSSLYSNDGSIEFRNVTNIKGWWFVSMFDSAAAQNEKNDDILPIGNLVVTDSTFSSTSMDLTKLKVKNFEFSNSLFLIDQTNPTEHASVALDLSNYDSVHFENLDFGTSKLCITLDSRATGGTTILRNVELNGGSCSPHCFLMRGMGKGDVLSEIRILNSVIDGSFDFLRGNDPSAVLRFEDFEKGRCYVRNLEVIGNTLTGACEAVVFVKYGKGEEEVHIIEFYGGKFEGNVLVLEDLYGRKFYPNGGVVKRLVIPAMEERERVCEKSENCRFLKNMNFAGESITQPFYFTTNMKEPISEEISLEEEVLEVQCNFTTINPTWTLNQDCVLPNIRIFDAHKIYLRYMYEKDWNVTLISGEGKRVCVNNYDMTWELKNHNRSLLDDRDPTLPKDLIIHFSKRSTNIATLHGNFTLSLNFWTAYGEEYLAVKTRTILAKMDKCDIWGEDVENSLCNNPPNDDHSKNQDEEWVTTVVWVSVFAFFIGIPCCCVIYCTCCWSCVICFELRRRISRQNHYEQIINDSYEGEAPNEKMEDEEEDEEVDNEVGEGKVWL